LQNNIELILLCLRWSRIATAAAPAAGAATAAAAAANAERLLKVFDEL
jgi:hypothetical protein